MKCENCGKETNGTYSEGGIKWAICEECMSAPQHNREDKPDKDRMPNYNNDM